MSDALKQALCCICGAVRTFKRARNHQEENYWLHGPVNRDWSRELGDLKCEPCGKVTTHALLHPEGGWAVDHAEMLQRIALGDRKAHPQFQTENEWVAKELAHITEQYRQSNYPPNPFVSHKWWKSAENDAREAGKKWFPAMCGEPVAVPEESRDGISITELWAPTQVTDPDRAEHENFDVDSGLWWTQGGQCVNCLRVRNNWLLDKRRKDVASLMRKLANDINDLDASLVHRLAELAETITGVGE